MIQMNCNSKLPLYIQIYRAFKNAIVSGQLPPKSKLESIRTLSETLNVSVNTVKIAYRQLQNEGFIESIPKSGYHVVDIQKYQVVKPDSDQYKSNAIFKSTKIEQENEDIIRYDFTYHKMSMELFRVEKWRKYVNEALLCCENEKMGRYDYGKGDVTLREEIRKYLELSRNVHCDVEQIVICSGIQDSIERLCHILPNTTVGLECPGIPLWRTIFERHGFQTVSLSVYPQNSYIEELYKSDAKIAITTPSHQFPTGYVLSLEERMQLLQWGATNDAILVEDDYDCEFRYASQPLSAIQSMDSNDCVLYMGTFSKILLPGLRISYMVLPKKLLFNYDKVYENYPSGVPWLSQKTLYYFMENDDFSRYIRRARNHFKDKYHTLIHACENVFQDKIDIIGTDAGLHVLIRIPAANSQKELIQKALQKGVRVYSVEEDWDCNQKAPENLILLGFSYIRKKDIYDGIVLLREAWKEYL